MEITIMHSQKERSDKDCGFLRFGISNRNTASVLLKSFANIPRITKGPAFTALPAQWIPPSLTCLPNCVAYDKNTIKLTLDGADDKWIVLKNGRFAVKADIGILIGIADSDDSDMIAVNIDKKISGYCEKARITPSSHVVGFSRWYTDSIAPVPVPSNWPHFLFIRSEVLPLLLSNSHLPLSFETLLHRSQKKSITVSSYSVGGRVLDLDTPGGLLQYATSMLGNVSGTPAISAGNTKIYGNVLAGENVTFGKNVKIIGPVIIEDNVSIPDGCMVNNSIIASDRTLKPGLFISNTIHFANASCNMQSSTSLMPESIKTDFILSNKNGQKKNDAFRVWPWFSYPRIPKSCIDFAGAAVILTLLAPVFFVLAILIKLTSRGPVFYKAVRQGKYGRRINCLKFRTMVAGAEKMQERLRIVNEVDGPQFKIVHDPRVSRIGRFLRDTCMDETPQFINVLLGQMSIVGPRPSPVNENSQCPSWRDARLSVKPGITGLWQISRTRSPSRDFQEWVYYDTEYIRRISLKTDLYICFKTVMKLINDFVDQF